MLRLLAVVALAACTKRTESQSLAPPSVAPPAVDKRVACRVDTDCEIFASCCAHCRGGTVISLNKAHASYGSRVTFTLYCPMCAEMGCIAPAPKRTPICNAGACARRDTLIDSAGVTTSTVVETDLVPDKPDPFAMLYLMCKKLVARGNKTLAQDCGGAEPQHSCPALERCGEAIERMPCPADTTLHNNNTDLTAFGALPACSIAALAAC